jgi:hypothetical protein
MKASRSGQIIGQALENSTSSASTILAYVSPGFKNINNTFVLGEDDGQLATATGTPSLVKEGDGGSSFLIDQTGAGDLLQLQQNGETRLLVSNNGSFNLFASTTIATSTILSVSNGTTTQFSITAAGHITVGKDTAGTATIKAGDNVSKVTFDTPYDSAPKIVVTAQILPNFFYGVATKTPDGFTIQMSATSTQDVTFDWIALAQPATTTSVSSQVLTVVSSPVTSVISLAPIPPPAPISPLNPSTPIVDASSTPSSGTVAGTSTPPATITPPADVTPPAVPPVTPPADVVPPVTPPPAPPADNSAPPPSDPTSVSP